MSGSSNVQPCPGQAEPRQRCQRGQAAALGGWPWALVDSELSRGQGALKQKRCRMVPSRDEDSQVVEQGPRGFVQSLYPWKFFKTHLNKTWSELVMDPVLSRRLVWRPSEVPSKLNYPMILQSHEVVS